MKPVRCAIYTRKSSDEGLEQDFNSLDAQREACAAYILSQASEGWKLLPGRYDDGGVSGGTLERPALQCLLDDVEAGGIDIIVVYKVDRLTRSLLDFSKLVEAFDAAGTSFVSVTQSFNTTTSMGRLTLNMLLSFAQFEREVTAERIRDKIAASKAKGMWMGGIPPLGYRPEGRSLAIVEEHAAVVREIFARYRRLGNVRLVADELAAEGITTPPRQTGKGRAYGGCAFTRGQLYALLRNPVYAGDISHKGRIHAGNHPPVIERSDWDEVQQQLAEKVRRVRASREKNASLLSGMLFDPDGEPLIAVHTTKGRQRYRYYVSRAQHHCQDLRSPALRLPAREIEQVVRLELDTLLRAPLGLIERLQLEVNASMLDFVTRQAAAFRADLDNVACAPVRKVIQRVVVYPERIELLLTDAWLDGAPGLAGGASSVDATHKVPVRLTRSGRVKRLVDDTGACPGGHEADEKLLRLLVTARRWWVELARGECDITALSRRENVSASWMTRVVRLAFLSPDVVDAIVGGRTRAGIDGKAMLAGGAISPQWSEQIHAFLPAAVR